MTGRIRVLAVVAGLAVVAAAVLVALNRGGGPDSDPDPDRPALAGYTITYRVEVTIDTPEISQRTVAVRRPFEGSDRSTPLGPAGQPTALVARDDHLYRIDPDRVVDLGDQGPAVAPGDLFIAPQLATLHHLGLARPRGSMTVAGRACRRYRFGGPVTDSFKPTTKKEYADACFDADGLMLAEDWYLDGKLLRQTRAETVMPTAPGDAVLDLGGKEIRSTPAVTVTPLPADRIPPTGHAYWASDSPPDGFRLLRRYHSAGADPGSGLALSGLDVTADAYQAGTDVIWVEHRSGIPVQPPEGTGQKVDAGALGAGWLWLTPQGPQVRVAGDGQVIVVRGTVSPARVARFARSLSPHLTGR